MKKMYALFIVLAASIGSVWAQTTVEVDGINYDLNMISGIAQVAFSPNASGDITIPATISYNGNNYDVTAIGNEAFLHCIDLTKIELLNSVTMIGEYAFSGCIELSSVVFEEGSRLTSIGQWTFSACANLGSIDIPDGVTEIGYGTFHSCNKLTSVRLPNSLTTIRSTAFHGTGLTKITIPANVTFIDGMVFSGCPNLEIIEISEGNRSYQFIDGNLLTADGTTLIACLNSRIDNSYKIPAGVRIIGQTAFLNCVNLTNIEISNSVTTIGGFAFAGSGLTEITLQSKTPPSLNGTNIFGNGTLTAIIVPEGSEEAYKSYVATTDEWGQTNDSWSNYAHLIKSNPTSTERINDIAVIAYPNPTTGIITVTGLTAGEAIKMYSLSGAQVGSYVAPAAEMTIDLSNLSSGMYFVSTGGQMVRIIKK